LFDLAELAKRRWIEGLSRKELAHAYGKTECAIQSHFQELKRKGFRVPGLTADEREGILWTLKS
jgi:biotin operon repressor